MTRHYLVTGGDGFIGSNYVHRLLQRGDKVTVYDNLSRAGARHNLDWLHQSFGRDSFTLIQGDVCDGALINTAARSADVIIHLAGQVAVTHSVLHPRQDFEQNAFGTLNVLEAARSSEKKPVLVYASTNKVYGGMEEVGIVEEATRYRYADFAYGISEKYPLDFHSPYGCSKGAGDQDVRDYARMYGLATVVFRQSCIFGQRQFGVEDQGWIAWFIIAALAGKPITIYGNGKQVRDVLFVSDLLNAYDTAIEQIAISAGQVYNIGGGIKNTLSVWLEFAPLLERLMGKTIAVQWGDWRPGDQLIYVSDIRKAQENLNWKPDVNVQEGIEKLYHWVLDNQTLFG